jgi:hypothetical protein
VRRPAESQCHACLPRGSVSELFPSSETCSVALRAIQNREGQTASLVPFDLYNEIIRTDVAATLYSGGSLGYDNGYPATRVIQSFDAT